MCCSSLPAAGVLQVLHAPTNSKKRATEQYNYCCIHTLQAPRWWQYKGGNFDRKYEKCIHQYKSLDANVSFERLVKRRFALATPSCVPIGLEAHASHEMQRGTNPVTKTKLTTIPQTKPPRPLPTLTKQIYVRQVLVLIDSASAHAPSSHTWFSDWKRMCHTMRGAIQPQSYPKLTKRRSRRRMNLFRFCAMIVTSLS